jgi:hypothetical protein
MYTTIQKLRCMGTDKILLRFQKNDTPKDIDSIYLLF